ncbi:MAG TPA: hypothetical protein GX521_06640 [Firmicutes bacterium]|nr:hypothetical protein [Bacillota bacterium]
MLSPEHKIIYLGEQGELCPHGHAGAGPFVVSAVVVEPENQESLSAAVESISAAEPGGAELRADAAGHGARFRILRRLLALPFQVLYIVVNQSELYPDGLAHWDSILGAVHKALFQLVLRSGSSLRLVFDEESSGQFLPGFQKYVESPGGQLFSPYRFERENSGKCNLLQLSHFIAGTLLLADNRGAPKHHTAYLNFLRDKIVGRALFPGSHEEYLSQASGITQWSIQAALDYIREHAGTNVTEELNRVIVTDRLLLQLQLEPKKYLGTAVLRKLIRDTSGDDYSDPQFRAQVIAPLRDAGLLISSSARGYKIPLTLEEVLSYSLHTVQMVYPMLGRLEKCRNAVLEATGGQCDILEQPEYEKIRAYFGTR